MDQVLEQLTDFVLAASARELSDELIYGANVRNLDGIACGAGAVGSGLGGVVRRAATGMAGPLCASIYGAPAKSSVGFAVFGNSSMNRYLDFNDVGEHGHPNDMSPGILALGEAIGSSGADVVLAMYVGYEVCSALNVAAPLWGSPWDYSLYVGLGAAAGMTKLLGLDAAQTAHALSLTLVTGVPMVASRTNGGSAWRSCAGGRAVRSALDAVVLAKQGMTGPDEAFLGPDGLFTIVNGSTDLGLAEPSSRDAAITRSALKMYPACYFGHVPIDLAITLSTRIESAAEIESLVVSTYEKAWQWIGGGAGGVRCWDPITREEADHSLPYLVAVAILDGTVTLDSFHPDRISDAAVRHLMQRIRVTHDQGMTDMQSETSDGPLPARFDVRLRSGEALTLVGDRPRGQVLSPMSHEEILAKFGSLVGDVLPSAKARRLRDLLWNFDRVTDLESVTQLFREFSPRRTRA